MTRTFTAGNCNLALPSSHTLPAASSSRKRIRNSEVVGQASQQQQQGVCLCGQEFSSFQARNILHAIGFALYTLASVRLLTEIFEITRAGLKKHELASIIFKNQKEQHYGNYKRHTRFRNS